MPVVPESSSTSSEGQVKALMRTRPDVANRFSGALHQARYSVLFSILSGLVPADSNDGIGQVVAVLQKGLKSPEHAVFVKKLAKRMKK